MSSYDSRWIIWGALVSSLSLYVGIALVIQPCGGCPPALLAAMASVAGTTALASVVIRVRLLVRPAHAGRLDLRQPEGAQRFLVISILTWALSESVAIYGFACFMLSGSFAVMLPFIAASLALFAYHAPRLAPLSSPPNMADLARRPDPIG